MIHAVFFDIGGTVHTQDATPESDRDYIRRLWCFLHMNHIYTAETPEQLLEHINAGAKAYKSYTEQELIELPPIDLAKFFLKDFDIPGRKACGTGRRALLHVRPIPQAHRQTRGAEGNAGGSQAARISAGCNLQHYEHDLRTAYSKGTRRRSVFLKRSP